MISDTVYLAPIQQSGWALPQFGTWQTTRTTNKHAVFPKNLYYLCIFQRSTATTLAVARWNVHRSKVWGVHGTSLSYNYAHCLAFRSFPCSSEGLTSLVWGFFFSLSVGFPVIPLKTYKCWKIYCANFKNPFQTLIQLPPNQDQLKSLNWCSLIGFMRNQTSSGIKHQPQTNAPRWKTFHLNPIKKNTQTHKKILYKYFFKQYIELN